MAKFKIGEVALALSKSRGDRECVVVSDVFVQQLIRGGRVARVLVYWIDVVGFPSKRKDGLWWCQEFALRKLDKPPMRGDLDKVVGWKDCAWKPVGVSV